jgi:hypothetical protein
MVIIIIIMATDTTVAATIIPQDTMPTKGAQIILLKGRHAMAEVITQHEAAPLEALRVFVAVHQEETGAATANTPVHRPAAMVQVPLEAQGQEVAVNRLVHPVKQEQELTKEVLLPAETPIQAFALRQDQAAQEAAVLTPLPIPDHAVVVVRAAPEVIPGRRIAEVILPALPVVVLAQVAAEAVLLPAVAEAVVPAAVAVVAAEGNS